MIKIWTGRAELMQFMRLDDSLTRGIDDRGGGWVPIGIELSIESHSNLSDLLIDVECGEDGDDEAEGEYGVLDDTR